MFDWITGAVEQTGYVGIALLMLAENLFPPIPSELIMPLAGFVAAQGGLNPVGVVAAGAAGSVLGTWVWYWAGRRLGCERVKALAARHGRWLTVEPREIDEAAGWFRRHCGPAVFFGRLVPAVRTLISVPAGIAGMDQAKFLAWSAAGTTLWTAALAAAGYLLEDQYTAVQGWLNPVSTVIFAAMALWYLYRVVTFSPGARHRT